MSEFMRGWLSSADALYNGSDRLTLPMAQATWAAYLAARISSSSISSVQEYADKLRVTIGKVKSAIDTEVLSYRTHRDLDRVLSLAQREATSLITMAAEVQDYLDGYDTTLHALLPSFAEVLEHSYFGATWRAIHPAMVAMYGCSMANPQTETNVDGELLEAVLQHYDTLGFVVKSMPDGQCYVEIPFRPSNSTIAMIVHNVTLALSNP